MDRNEGVNSSASYELNMFQQVRRVRLKPVPYKELRGKNHGASSAEMRARVCAAREIQRRGFYNTHIQPNALRKLCALDDAGERTLEMAVRRLGFSARAHDRILKVLASPIPQTLVDPGSRRRGPSAKKDAISGDKCPRAALFPRKAARGAI